MFILATTGSAVGLGNIWKFPYITGENGGGAFVLIYLLCIVLIGIPIMVSEILIGRRGRQSPVYSLRTLAREEGGRGSGIWGFIGFSGIFAGVIIISFYSVVAGWSLAYVVRTGSGLFVDVTASGSRAIFNQLVSDPERLLAWHTIFMVMTTVVVARGVRSGLEQTVRILMPLLFLLLVLLVLYAYDTGEFKQGYDFLFSFDYSSLTPGGVVIAMGHAFFTLSLGIGAVMMYGSYLPSEIPIARTALAIAVIDTLVALLAGLAIFPLVFASNLKPGEGPGLLFETLPIAFGQMPGGTFYGVLFFILLLLAAWTSSISMIEPAVAWLVENRRITRLRSAAVVGLFAWLLGIVTIMSFSSWSFQFSFGGKLKHSGMFDVLDILTSSIMLPLGGLAFAIFAGWVMSRDSVQDELKSSNLAFFLWYQVVRYVTPVAVVLIFLKGLDLI